MPHLYATSREKQVDLWLGFGGWFAFSLAVLSSAMWIPGFNVQSAVGIWVAATLLSAFMLLVTRPYGAFGWLLAAVAVVAVVVVELPFFLASLVVGVATGGLHTDYCGTVGGFCLAPPSTTVALLLGFAVFLAAAWFTLRGIHRRIG